jgi:hypothetical protein
MYTEIPTNSSKIKKLKHLKLEYINDFEVASNYLSSLTYF